MDQPLTVASTPSHDSLHARIRAEHIVVRMVDDGYGWEDIYTALQADGIDVSRGYVRGRVIMRRVVLP